MQVLTAKVGDKVWIAVGEEKLAEGEVVLTFFRYGITQYVIEVDTHIDPILVVRNGFSISDAQDAPLAWGR